MTHSIKAKTPKGAANATLRAIQKEPGGEYASVRRNPNSDKGWQLVWEEGPYEWTVIATGPGDIWAEELGGTLTDAYQRNEPTFDFFPLRGYVFPEPQNSYILNFWGE